MNYATIKNCDIANGPGVRVSLFVSGCTHHCPGCFNEVAWDFGYGEPFTQQTIDTILDMLRPDYIRGLTLLGGEPFEPENQGAIVELLRQIKRKCQRKASGRSPAICLRRTSSPVGWGYTGILKLSGCSGGRPLWKQRKTCPCGSVARRTSGSLTFRLLWPRENHSLAGLAGEKRGMK